eukprot:TRINITY_DN10416_c0_g2_i1.p2 TRINITY_DN10416_c0_g2~~TRINITY_DN10416_c0_g2_i1.p2  ORF type:complete len:640 (+),score=181.82 TRINITY_DN10416_c0_g2_i1:2315-4234(+)
MPSDSYNLGEDDALLGGSSRKRSRSFLIAAVVAVIIGAAIVLAVVLTKGDSGNDASASAAQFADDFDAEKIMVHLRALDDIAKKNGGSRTAANGGFNASVDYILKQLEQTNYLVETQHFQLPAYVPLQEGVFNLTIGTTVETFTPDVDFEVMQFTGNGTLANISLVGITTATAGCNESDYTGNAGKVVLVPYGVCGYYDKAVLAKQADVAGIIYGNRLSAAAPLRSSVKGSNLGDYVDLPMLGLNGVVTRELQDVLATGQTVYVDIVTSALRGVATSTNIIATTPSGRADRKIVVGSHLDSVPFGPGINDNGSGSSLNLELALSLFNKGTKVENQAQFMFYGGEELGLLGSYHYVESLIERNASLLEDVACMLNFDMIGSPNYIRGVYDAESASPEQYGEKVYQGSSSIQEVFQQRFDEQGLGFDKQEFSGRSDYGPFIANNVPAGGLFTGAEVLKTPAQRKLVGGSVGVSFDTCYHKYCDDIDNINQQAVREMSDAAAYTFYFLVATSDVKGFLYKNMSSTTTPAPTTPAPTTPTPTTAAPTTTKAPVTTTPAAPTTTKAPAPTTTPAPSTTTTVKPGPTATTTPKPATTQPKTAKPPTPGTSAKPTASVTQPSTTTPNKAPTAPSVRAKAADTTREL